MRLLEVDTEVASETLHDQIGNSTRGLGFPPVNDEDEEEDVVAGVGVGRKKWFSQSAEKHDASILPLSL